MIFPERSVNNFVLKENAIKENLTEFTLCLFVRMEPSVGCDQFIYSYAVMNSPGGNGIYLALKSTASATIKFKINDDRPR